MELYEQRYGDKPPPKGAPHPDLREVGLAESTLMRISDQIQQLLGLTAGVKKPKVKPLPRPRTAVDEIARRAARAQFEHFEQVLNFVPQEQFEKTIREAQGGE